MKRFAQVGRFIRMGSVWAACLAGVLLAPLAAQAQFTANNQTNIIDGVTSNWGGNAYYVGSNTIADVLMIQNGGVLTNVGLFHVGYIVSASNNVVVVNGNGSCLYNNSYQYIGEASRNNQMVITNGGKVVLVATLGYGSVVGAASPTNNVVIVSGTGSLWDVRILQLGNGGGFNGDQVYINNGGTVIVRDAGASASSIGFWGDSDTLVVSDAGSSLTVYHNLYVGEGGNPVGVATYANNNVLILTNGGTVNLLGTGIGGLIIGNAPSTTGNTVQVNGGNLWVTNSTGQRNIAVCRGTLTINSGNVLTDTLLLTNANTSVLKFNGGNLAVRNTIATNGAAFVVGNGSSAATLSLVSPAGVVGTHSFSNGLVIASNATLAIGGTNTIRQATINGNVTFQPGAVLDLDYSASTNDFAQVNGTVTVPTVGTLRLRALDASTRVPITVLQATQINGTPLRWPAVTVNGSNYQVYVVGNQLVIKRPSPPPGTMFMFR